MNGQDCYRVSQSVFLFQTIQTRLNIVHVLFQSFLFSVTLRLDFFLGVELKSVDHTDPSTIFLSIPCLRLRMSQTHLFTVAMTCGGCSGAVERILGKLKGMSISQILSSLHPGTL